MALRIRRDLRPRLEWFESRELLSSITDVMAVNGLRAGARVEKTNDQAGAGSDASGAAGSGGASSSSAGTSITLNGTSLTQGPLLNPDGSINNMALAPTGTPKPGQVRRQQFTARFVGPYSVVPGRTNTQKNQVLIQGAGTSTTMLHSDIQIRFVTPDDPTLPIGGVGTVFDRNINTNTALGLDLAAPPQNVDGGGRPNHIPTVSIDDNASSGIYVESYATGVMKIHYIPSGKHTPGVLSQGTAIVTIHAQIYSPDVSNILRNVAYNP